jgi:hypothetical protein
MVGCDRSRDGADASSPDAADASSDPERAEPPDERDGRSMELTEAGRERAERRQSSGDGGTGPAAAPPRDGRPSEPPPSLDPRDSAFAAHRLAAAALYPYDFRIGSLRTSGLSRTELSGRAAAVELLREAVEGDATPQELAPNASPGVHAALQALADSSLAAEDLRIGRPVRLSTGEYSVVFRFLGQAESWTGELVLEMADSGWYTSDIQVNTLGIDDVQPFVPGIDVPAADW